MASKPKKKAPSRLSQKEKELLERRAAGQLKRKATLEHKKKEAARAAKVNDHVNDAAPQTLGSRETSNFEEATKMAALEEMLGVALHQLAQVAKQQAAGLQQEAYFLPPQPMCAQSVAGPTPSALVEIRMRLQDLVGQQGYIIGTFDAFFERAGIPRSDRSEGGVDTPKDAGILQEIGALLSLIESQGGKLVDSVHKLDAVA